MEFVCVHAVGNRERWKTQNFMSRASAAVILEAVGKIDGISGVAVNPRTGSVTVTFETWSAQKALHAYFLSTLKMSFGQHERLPHEERVRKVREELLEKQAKAVRISGKFSELCKKSLTQMPVIRLCRYLTGTCEDFSQKGKNLDFSSVFHWIFVRPFLPAPLNIANAVLGAVPHIVLGVKALSKGRFTVDVLDASALSVSLIRRDFRTVGLVAMLLGLGEMLEQYTRKQSLASLAERLAVKVDTVWVRNGASVVEKPLKDVQLSDTIVVRSGSAIPVDGTVLSGEAAVNQASMTGEALAVRRSKGSTVFAGTVVEDGEIDIAPKGIGGDTRLNQIVQFIESNEKVKAGIESKAEHLADAIVPYNLLLAAAVWLSTRSLVRLASVLLVDYSCALRLATPLAIMTGMREGTELGVLIKGGKYLEALAQADTVVFDKTGTLTNAAPKLSDTVSFDKQISEDELMCLTACIEEHFPHPVSRAIVNAAKARGLEHYVETHDAEVKYIVAHGICSSISGKQILVGSRHFVEEDEHIDIHVADKERERLASEGKSILYVAYDGTLIGILGIEDPIRAESASVISALRNRGINRIVMLTGDDERTACAVAHRLGIHEYHAQVLPTDKSRYIEHMKAEGAKVLMIGDGINDSPALSAADVGVTLSEGSAIAQEVADVVLTNGSLTDLPAAIDLSRSCMEKIRTNFTVSVALNTVFITGGLIGVLPPVAGAVLHNLTTLGVCVNAMRSPRTVSGILSGMRTAVSLLK